MIDYRMSPAFKREFVQALSTIIAVINDSNERHGFGEGACLEDGTRIALMHAELSEALEAMRRGNPPSGHISEFSGVEEELADTVIRICHLSALRQYRLGEAILAKVEFNDGREYKHGKAF